MSAKPITRLKALRLGKGLGRDEVAAALEVKPRSLRHWETTGTVPQDPATVKRITEFYEVKVADIWPVEDVAA